MPPKQAPRYVENSIRIQGRFATPTVPPGSGAPRVYSSGQPFHLNPPSTHNAPPPGTPHDDAVVEASEVSDDPPDLPEVLYLPLDNLLVAALAEFQAIGDTPEPLDAGQTADVLAYRIGTTGAFHGQDLLIMDRHQLNEVLQYVDWVSTHGTAELPRLRHFSLVALIDAVLNSGDFVVRDRETGEQMTAVQTAAAMAGHFAAGTEGRDLRVLHRPEVVAMCQGINWIARHGISVEESERSGGGA